MKITLIAPPLFIDGHKVKGMPLAPPVLEYLAGLTAKVAPEFEIELIDACQENVSLNTLDADLVGFTVLTPQAPWVYQASDLLKKRGLKTVLGGIHVTALPKEAASHSDSIVIGEAESVWKNVLTDFTNNTLKKVYKGERLPLKNLPYPKCDLLKPNYAIRGFFTSRGCPHHCIFCSVRKFFGDTVRYRPIDEVVNEVASSKQRLLINIDDNIWGTNISRSIEFYKELSKNVRFKWWVGQADLVTAQHKKADELLKWGRKSGLVAVIVGWESNNPLTLAEYKATAKQGKNRREAIKKIRAAGIEVELFIVLGGLNDTPDDFQRALDICDELKISAHIVLITPYPGTELYDLYKEHIFSDLDWDKYDGNKAVFKHSNPNMSVKNREQAILEVRKKIYALAKIPPRIRQISLKGFPMSHITSLMFQYQQRKSFAEFSD